MNSNWFASFRGAARLTMAGLTLLAMLLATSVFSPLAAQTNVGKILGTVSDSSGGVVPGAKLTASSPTLPSEITVSSDEQGRYSFESLPIGVYAVSVQKEGFQVFRQQNIQVSLGAQVDFNPKLTVGQITQVVEVAATAISLDVTSSRQAVNITAAQMDGLPKGRTFNSLLQMAPGVRQELKSGNDGVGGIQVDGASGSENSFVIDGVDVSDIRRGSLKIQNAIPFEFLQEVEVKSSGFEAQYGGATGGVINVATKSGTNAFHGAAWYQWQSESLLPRPRGYWQRSISNANVAEFFAPVKDPISRQYPGGLLSGPILKNKLFFTAGYNPTIEQLKRSRNYANGKRDTFQDMLTHYGFGRIDYSPTSKLQVNSSWIWSPQRRTGALAPIDGRLSAPSNDLSITGGWQPAQTYTASVNYLASSKFLISARYGYKFQNDKMGNYGVPTAPYLIYQQASSAAGQTIPAELSQGRGWTNVSSTFSVLRDITTRHNVYLDGSYMANLGGQQHNFKFGYSVSRIGNDVEDDYLNGRFDIYWGDPFNRGQYSNVKGKYGYYIWEDGVRHKAAVNSRNQGFYVQDAWRVHKRVTLNLGVRFENEFLPPYRKEQGGVKVANPVAFSWGDKIAPRIGGAWDILGDGRWKLSGSFGFFYDVMKYELARGSFGGDYWVSNVYKLDNLNLFSLGKANPGAGGEKITQYDNRTIPINARGELEGIDPNIKPFKERRFNFALERQLAARVMASVRYARSDVLYGIEDIGVLDADDNEVYLIGNPGFGDTRNAKSVYGGKTTNGKEWLVPKAVRQYDAVEFRLQGQWNKLQWLSSYTWSRLYGNWSGLANSDESGRSDPGVSRAFDLPYYYFDATGSQKNVLGRLATDRPHELKFFGSYELKTVAGTTNFGLNQIAYAGTPDSTSVIYLSAPTFPFGRGDMGRTPILTQTDLSVMHTIRMGERYSVRLEANLTNLFNQAAVISRTTQFNRAGAISFGQLPLDKFFAGYDPRNFVKVAGSVPYNPIYGLPGGNYRAGGAGAYQAPRDVRFGLRFSF